MAKELPYFKFEPNQWENGNIQICNREDKGLFIDLCSMYWSRLGDLPIKLAIQRLCNGNATAFNSLIEESIFKVIDGQICIDFLNEQLIEFENLSTTNSENARLGWEKRRKNATALGSQSDGNAIREDKSKEEEIKEKPSKQSSDNLLSEIESFKSIKVDGFDLSNSSEEFKKYFGVADGFRKLIMSKIESSGGSVEKLKDAKIGAWVKPIRDMYVIDKIEGKSIEMVYKWLPTSDFWSNVILSTQKLREKFNQLVTEAKKNKPRDTSKSIY